jgi:hypothetical protein
MVKIGLTDNIDRRLVLLQSGHYETLEVLRIIKDCDWRTERWFHEKYNHICVRGEWFNYHHDMLSITPTNEELATIKRKTRVMVNGIGKPGRPTLASLGETSRAMTSAERMRNWRQRRKIRPKRVLLD